MIKYPNNEHYIRLNNKIYNINAITSFDENIKHKVYFDSDSDVWIVLYKFNIYFGGDVCTLEQREYFYKYTGLYKIKSFGLFKFKIKEINPMFMFLNEYGYLLYTNYYNFMKRHPTFNTSYSKYISKVTKTVELYNTLKLLVDLIMDTYNRIMMEKTQ